MDLAWLADGACNGMDLDLFDDLGPSVRDAKLVCHACPVRAACLDVAFILDEAWGVWGGLTTVERRAHRDGERLRPCADCGLPFARARYDQCAECRKPPSHGPNVLSAHANTIAEMAGTGMIDREIAVQLSNELGQAFNASHIRYIRRRFDIPAGSSRPPPLAIPPHMPPEPSTLRGVDRARRVDMMRDWLKRGGTTTTFCRHYHCTGSVAKALQQEAQGDTYVQH